jgi:putative transposase
MPGARHRSHHRWDVPGAVYFVTTVTQDRVPRFAAPNDAQLVLDSLRLVQTTHPFKMLGYVIMPDHVHILWHLGQVSISVLMHAFKWQVTRHYKASHPELGSLKLWQKGYWDHVVRPESELDPILGYIHYNPVKHGLVQDAAVYRFSSLGAYIERNHDTEIGEAGPSWGEAAEP